MVTAKHLNQAWVPSECEVQSDCIGPVLMKPALQAES